MITITLKLTNVLQASFFLLCMHLNITHAMNVQNISNDDVLKKESSSDVWLTIFVHGNYGSALTILSFEQIIRDHYSQSWYHKAQTWLRNNTFINRDSFLAFEGLHCINNKICAQTAPLRSFIDTYRQVLHITNPQQASTGVFYTFGWSGLLSQKARRHDAIKFYKALSDEIYRYKLLGKNPRLRIICHSHGGNVALNLAGISHVLNQSPCSDQHTTKTVWKLYKENNQACLLSLDKTLHVDELILMGTPIQQETEAFVTSDFFKKIFHFYSRNDIIQIIDFISTNGLTSKHTISNHFISPKIYQTCINIKESTHNTHTISEESLPQIESLRQAILQIFAAKKNGRETESLVQALEKIIQAVPTLLVLPEKKLFDFNLFTRTLRNIQYNMKYFPDDPVHSDFVMALLSPNKDTINRLPLLVWIPLFCKLIEQAQATEMLMIFNNQDVSFFAPSSNSMRYTCHLNAYVHNYLRKTAFDALHS